MLTFPHIQLAEQESSPERLEIKYTLPTSSHHLLRSFLQNRFKQRSFNKTVSHVRSIYLDTHSLQRVEQSLAGLPKRSKLRIRWYDNPLPTDFFYLELKERVGKYNKKERCKFIINRHSDSIEQQCQIDSKELAHDISDTLRYQLHKGDIPIVLIEYKRLHFEATHLPIRITLDYEINASRIRRLNPIQVLGKKIPFGVPVLEVKTSPEYEPEIAGLLSPLRLRKSRYSKYLQGCRVFGSMLGNIATMIEQDGC